MKRADQIRKMTDQELVAFFHNTNSCEFCVHYDRDNCEGLDCQTDIKEWLEADSEEA
jgi:hypothetical protein